MAFNFKRIFPESEKVSGLIAHFYNFLPAKLLQPVYQHISRNLPLKNHGILIDIGTGPGFLARLIAQKYPGLKVIGVDLSETMIKIAEKKKKNSVNLDFKVMDANNLEFPDSSADYVVSTLTAHHWKTPLKVLNEIYRVLKPGGLCWIFDGYSGALDQDIDKSLKYPFFVKPPRSFIRKMFSWHGFSKQEIETKLKPLIEKSRFKQGLFQTERIYIKIELRKRMS